MKLSLTRRSLLAATGAGLLSACASPRINMVANRAVMLTTGTDSDRYPWTRAEVNSFPYAQMATKFGNMPRAVLILAEMANGQQKWTSSDGISIYLQGPRLVATRGLPADLVATTFSQVDSLTPYVPGPIPALSESQRLVRVRASKLLDHEAPLHSSIHPEGDETITILDQEIKTVRVREDFECAALGWRGTNLYWLSKRNSLAWRSIQSFAPGQPALTLEILKRPA